MNQMMAQHMAAPPPYATVQNPHYVHGMHQANQAMNAAAKGIGLAVGIVIGVSVLLVIVGAIVAVALLGR